MKKLFFPALFAVTGAVFVSCSGKSGGMSDKAKKNLEVNQAITKAYEDGDFSKMKDYIAADAIDHGGETGDVKGLDSIVAQMKRYHEMMPDMKGETVREMADDEYVMTWAKMTGTMNGKPITMTSVDVSKFKDGKAVEHWVYMDPRDMAQMMAAPAPAMPVPDTAKAPD